MQPSDSPLRHYLQVLKRQAWLVVLVPALTLAAAVAILETHRPVYRASMTLVVGEPRGELPPVLGTHSVSRTMTNLIESDLVVRGVIRELRLNKSAEKFREDLSVNVLPDTSVLDVTYDSTDRELALNVVSQLARIFTRQVDQTLGVRSGARQRPGSFELIVRVFDPPHLEPEPVAPKTGTNLVFAGVAGLALGLLLAVAREALDSRLRGRKDAEQWFRAPVVGTLPAGMDRRPPPGVGADKRRHRHDDERVLSLDLLRARLQFAQLGLSGPTILVMSAGGETGKSAVTATIGAALALGGKRVICVDADLRRPRLHRSLGLENANPGLADVLAGAVDPEEALIRVQLAEPTVNGAGPSEATGRLEVLPAGSSPVPLVGLLTPEVLSSLIERLYNRADYVVFDSPPLAVADSFPLAIQSDNVLVVARRGRTTKDQAESVRATLEELGVEKIGVVLTDAPPIER